MSSPLPRQLDIQHVLVTGATGFIGAHVVDVLLSRGIRVRGTTRSPVKARAMMDARPEHADKLSFVTIADFANEKQSRSDIARAVDGCDAVIHVASPFDYTTTNPENDLIIPAIAGVKSVLSAAHTTTTTPIRRIVLTSSFASVMDASRTAPPYFTYTSADWNPLTLAEATSPLTPAFIAYRASKKLAEQAAWNFLRDKNPKFDLVTLCPPMTFGPVAHPVATTAELNESNVTLWAVARGVDPLPVARVPFWIDVRDLARSHVEALVRVDASGKRYIPAAGERFSYGLAARIVREEFEWAREQVSGDEQEVDESYGVDGETAGRELGVVYRGFRETVVDFVRQARGMSDASPTS